jgi:uncharacterized repeat protein (TIGR02543 family)
MKKVKYVFLLIVMSTFFFSIVSYANETATITFEISEAFEVAPTDVLAPSPIIGSLNKPIIHIPVISSSTHTFLGWYRLINNERVYLVKGDIIDSDMTLYGAWRLTPRVIEYNLNGGTNHPNNIFMTDSLSTFILNVPTKEGHIFSGWYMNNTLITELISIKRSKTVVEARWEALPIKMTIQLNNGSNDVINNYSFGDSYELIQPTFEGYSFVRYEVEGIPFLAEGIISQLEDFEVDVVWEANVDTKYRVETYRETLDGDYEVQIETLSGVTNALQTITPTAIVGFSLNEDDSVLSGTIVGDGSLILKVFYDRNIYNISFFDIDDDIIEVQQIKFQGFSTPPTFNVDGYTVSWSITDLSEITMNLNIDVILTPITYTITFDSFDIEPIQVNYDASIGTLPVPNAPEGFIFNGWKDSNDRRISNTSIFTYLEDLTLFAEFVVTPQYEYAIAYAFENVSGEYVLDNSKTVILRDDLDKTVTALELEEALEFYTLKETLPSGIVNSNDNLVLTVRYERVSFDVDFLNENGNIIKSERVKYERNATPPSLSVDGYSVSWNFSQYSNIASDVVVSPILTVINYSITYDYLINSFDSSYEHINVINSYNIESNDITLSSPSRNAFNFLGWYDNESLEGNPIETMTQGSFGDVHLFAKWEIKAYVVTFSAEDNQSVSIEVNHGETIDTDLIPNITLESDKIGYYWFFTFNDIDYEFDVSIPITQDYQLKLLVVDSVTIQYIYNFDDTIENIKVLKGAILESSNNPEREGFTFVDWYLDDEFNAIYSFGEVVTDNLVLYAKWIPKFGEAIYSTPGTYTWTVPDGVTTISVLAIGSSGATSNYATIIAYGEAGGAGWINNYAVTPGETFTVVVGKAYLGEVSYFGSASLVAGLGGKFGSIVAYSRAEYGSGLGTYVGEGGINGENGSKAGTGRGYDIYNPNLPGGYGSINDGAVRIVWDENSVEFPSINTSEKNLNYETNISFNSNNSDERIIDWDTSSDAMYYVSYTYTYNSTYTMTTYTYNINKVSYETNVKTSQLIGLEEIKGSFSAIKDLSIMKVENGDVYVLYNISSINSFDRLYLKIYDHNLVLKETHTLHNDTGSSDNDAKMFESNDYVYIVFKVRSDSRVAYYQIDKNTRNINIGINNGVNIGIDLTVSFPRSMHTLNNDLYILDGRRLIIVYENGNLSTYVIDANFTFGNYIEMEYLEDGSVVVLGYGINSNKLRYYKFNNSDFETLIATGIVTNNQNIYIESIFKSQSSFRKDNIIYLYGGRYQINLTTYELIDSELDLPYIKILKDKMIYISNTLYLMDEFNNNLYKVNVN